MLRQLEELLVVSSILSFSLVFSRLSQEIFLVFLFTSVSACMCASVRIFLASGYLLPLRRKRLLLLYHRDGVFLLFSLLSTKATSLNLGGYLYQYLYVHCFRQNCLSCRVTNPVAKNDMPISDLCRSLETFQLLGSTCTIRIVCPSIHRVLTTSTTEIVGVASWPDYVEDWGSTPRMLPPLPP